MGVLSLTEGLPGDANHTFSFSYHRIITINQPHSTPTVPTDHIPQRHISTFIEHVQGTFGNRSAE